MARDNREIAALLANHIDTTATTATSRLHNQAQTQHRNSTRECAEIRARLIDCTNSILADIGASRHLYLAGSQRARRDRQILQNLIQHQETTIDALQATVDSYLVRLDALHTQGDFVNCYIQAIGNHLRVWI